MRIVAVVLLLARGVWAASPEQLKAELLKADTDFAALTAQRGLDGFLAYLAEGVLKFGEKGKLLTTKEQAREQLKRSFDTPGFQLRWKPLGAEVAASGDLGYTWGEYEAAPAGRRGHYLTVWKRQKDGTWKVVADVGN